MPDRRPAIDKEISPMQDFLVCITWDDGLTSDLPLIDWLNSQGLISSFCLSPGRYRKHPRRNDSRGDYGTLVTRRELTHYQPHDILSHGFSHADLTRLSPAALVADLKQAQDALEDRFERPVTCLSYPYGQFHSAVQAAASQFYLYARTTVARESLVYPGVEQDPLGIVPLAHWLHPELLTAIQIRRPRQLLLYGHTYEFRHIPYGFPTAISLYQQLRDLGARFCTFTELMDGHTDQGRSLHL